MTTLGRWSVLLTLAVSLGAHLSRPRSTEAQQRGKPRASDPRLGAYPDAPGRLRASRLARLPGVPRAPTAVITESEPNDDAPSADAVALGDTVNGNVDPLGDLDWFVFNVASDTLLVLDVDANQLGSPLDPVLWLVAPDGSTVLAFNDDFDGYDSYIEYHITTPGQYYAVVAAYDGGGGTGEYYYLNISGAAPPPPGPGDPTTLFATGLDGPYGVAAGPAGEFYVTDVNAGRRLLRVSSAGAVSTVASFGNATPIKVVLDGFGNLLVSYGDSGFVRGGVYRVTPAGQVSSFATGLYGVGAITVGPDGDVWVLDVRVHALFRFDPFGVRKDSIDVTAANAFRVEGDLAFSPSGVLYLSNGYDAVFRIVNRVPQLAISGPPYMESIAFDRDGYLYVANGFLGEVLLYDPSQQLVADPFARSNLGGPIYLAFGRTTNGSMTSRLFASNYGYLLSPPYIGSMVEMRNAAMRAPGFRVGVDLLAISTASLPAGVMGADYSATLQVTSPPGTPSWSVANGALPPGLSLNSSAGTITGVPEAAGDFTFVVRVDAGGRVGFRSFTLSVSQPSVSIADAANQLLESVQLAPALLRFLDLQGNANGRYDVGDFRAYLRSQGLLPAAPAAVAKERP
jgi:hypothetical protein